MTEMRQAHDLPAAGEIAPASAARLPYSPPRLEVLGALRTVTLGPSPGLGESVGGQTHKGGTG